MLALTVIAQGASAMQAGTGIETTSVQIDAAMDYQKPAGFGLGWFATGQPRVSSLNRNVSVIVLAWTAFAAILWHPAIHLLVLSGAFCFAVPFSGSRMIQDTDIS